MPPLVIGGALVKKVVAAQPSVALGMEKEPLVVVWLGRLGRQSRMPNPSHLLPHWLFRILKPLILLFLKISNLRRLQV